MELTMKELQYYLEVALLVAQCGGKEALKFFRTEGLKVESKLTTSFDPVTKADKDAERMMRDHIKRYFPSDGVIGEEYNNIPSASGITWVIDPIDGTRAFVSGTPSWGVLVAVNNGNIPIIGVIYQPFTGEIFYGGQGVAYFRRNGEDTKINVRRCAKISQAILFSTYPEIGTQREYNQFQLINKMVMQTRYGFDCYAYAMLAMGFIDIIMEAGLKSYDIQAPYALICAAGGVASNWNGCDPQFGGTFLACGDKHLHSMIISELSRS